MTRVLSESNMVLINANPSMRRWRRSRCYSGTHCEKGAKDHFVTYLFLLVVVQGIKKGVHMSLDRQMHWDVMVSFW